MDTAALTVQLSELLRQPYCTAEYLDQFSLQLTHPISVVVATRNRCPYPADSALAPFNPLRMCLELLAKQHAVKLHEIIVVNDGSTDHTETVVRHLESELKDVGVTLNYFQTPERLRQSRSRWLGTQIATAEIVAYVDDDCLFPPYFLFGGANSLLEPHQGNVAVVGLPCYYRTQRPHRVVGLEQIGYLSISEARWEGNFDAFPREYLLDTNFLSRPMHIMPSFEVEWCLAGAVVAWRDAIIKSEAFPAYQQHASWGEALEFATSLRNAGYTVAFCPDPKFGMCHLKFGTRGRYPAANEERMTWIPALSAHLGELIFQAEQERPESGLRGSNAQFSFMETLGYFSFLLHYDVDAAINFAVRTYNDYVVQGHIFHRSISTIPEDSEERYKIWQQAIDSGVRLAEQYFSLTRDEILRPPLNALLAASSQDSSR